LEAPGKYQAALVGGVDPTWRQAGTPEFQAMLMTMTALQPWSVGRVIKDPATGYKIQNTTLWAGDMEKCKANNVMFIPVINSGTHIAGPPPIPPAVPVVPRRSGNYLWEQFVAASKTGTINSAFIAMFDEINEGTQIMKIENNPPTQAPFLTYDGATSDYYLRLVGVGAKMLKNHTPITPTIPISPFNPDKNYLIKNRTSGLALNGEKNATDVTQTAITLNNKNLEWQLIYDGNGYFKIKNKASGKVLSALGTADVSLVKDANTDNTKWHLEWDGTSFCRIINKTNGRAISSNTPIAPNGAVAQVADASMDDLRWKITQQ
jgi:Ricin-type beta-trefoil lectin domain-like